MNLQKTNCLKDLTTAVLLSLPLLVAAERADASGEAAAKDAGKAPRTLVSKVTQKTLKLAFEDEFDGPGLDETKWRRIPSTLGKRTSDWNRYTSERKDLVEFRDGAIALIGKVNVETNVDTRPFVQGQIYSAGKFSFTRGKVEIRAKFENAKGSWPAFWLLPEKGRWPDDGEIDIVERLNHEQRAFYTAHNAWTYTMKKGNEPKQGAVAPLKANEYNVFSVELTDDAIVWTVNGQEVHRYPNLHADPRQYPWRLPNYILLDQQLGGGWVGEVDPKELPSRVWIDWVRVYLPE